MTWRGIWGWPSVWPRQLHLSTVASIHLSTHLLERSSEDTLTTYIGNVWLSCVAILSTSVSPQLNHKWAGGKAFWAAILPTTPVMEMGPSFSERRNTQSLISWWTECPKTTPKHFWECKNANCKCQGFLFTNDKNLTQTTLMKEEVGSIIHMVACAREWLCPQSRN